MNVQNPEKMAAFFDLRATDYDNHMKDNLEDFSGFYSSIAELIPTSEAPLKILDLGVGTGLELDLILPRLPYARYVLIDVSSEMLNRLKEKFSDKTDHFTFYNESYLNWEFPFNAFDIVISAQSLHHLLFQEKLELYRHIRNSLKPGGSFIEADFIVSDELEKQYLKKYLEIKKELKNLSSSAFHIDIPLSHSSTVLAHERAEFKDTKTVYRTDFAAILLSKR